MKTIILLRGIPGAGKSTLASLLLPNKPHCIRSADMYFEDEEGNYKFNARELPIAHKWCKNQVEYLMDDKEDLIIVENTFTQEWEMADYFDLANKYDYRIVSLIVENRHGSKSIHNVPQDKIDMMKERFTLKLV
jgi:predicted kinase